MYNITLIATGHSERGKCNSNELFRIIERIAPEVIFEEVPPHKFDGVYKGTVSDSLETTTIKRYLDKYPIDHFPVDKDVDQIIGNRFRKDIRDLDYIIGNHSPEYNYLSDQHLIMVERYGFPYLNSNQCEEFLERRRLLEEEIVRNINHEQLSQKYMGWLEYNDLREIEMINSVFKYSGLQRYDMALFLVGVEHRKPIMDKLPKLGKKKKPELNWIFNYLK